ncbi:MAG: GNAT family N-acetyltransferase, partial [Candidatus Lokiarchaeota archaeon]|nr:GNAT family N-acetyltransferase [Candidatus Lokiarchaeota archaeon]
YRAINLILDRAFNQLKLHKVYLLVAEDNDIAKHLYKKCGFLEEGFLIKY